MDRQRQRATDLAFYYAYRAKSPENSRYITLNVKDGMLLVFPDGLVHSVEPNQSDKERISISFNIMFSSYTETMSAPKWKVKVDQNKA